MKKYFIPVLAALSIVSCNDGKKEKEVVAETEKVNASTTSTDTYAEISIKEGGEWQGREYEGGEFKNVDTLTVPENHTDHSWFIRYEGPGWENKQVGYRLYLDWRNAIDIF